MIDYILGLFSAGIVCIAGAVIVLMFGLKDAALVFCVAALVFALLGLITTIVGMWRDK